MSTEEECFVAWLSSSGSELTLNVGEMHFTNMVFGCKGASAYCVVFKLLELPPPASAASSSSSTKKKGASSSSDPVFTFVGGFPFQVIPASSCVGVELLPVRSSSSPPNSTFSLPNSSSVRRELSKLASPCPSDWQPPIPSDLQATVNGVQAWCAVGEAKTGWDLSRIEASEMTCLENLKDLAITPRGSGASPSNPLLRLYASTCAHSPLSSSSSRAAIEQRFEWRTALCSYFSWSVPTSAALQTLEALSPLLEIGAGTGYWAHLLGRNGCDVRAYDMRASHEGRALRFRHPLVLDGGVEQCSLKEHDKCTLFMAWPDIVGDDAKEDKDRGSFGLDCLKTFKGKTVAYVGELGPNVCRTKKGFGDVFPPGGSSASAAFQKLLTTEFNLVTKVCLPNWPPYNAHLYVFERIIKDSIGGGAKRAGDVEASSSTKRGKK